MDPTLFALRSRNLKNIKVPESYINTKQKNVPELYLVPHNTKRKNKSQSQQLNGYFKNNEALALADIDSVYHLSDHRGALLSPQTTGPFTYLDLSGKFSGFSEYLRYRRPMSYGYALPIKSYDDGEPRFEIIEGIDDLYAEYDTAIQRFKNINPGRCDLVVNPYGDNHVLGSVFALIFAKKETGHYVTRIDNSIQSKSLIYILSMGFSESILMKSLYDRQWYYIGRFRNTNEEIIDLLLNFFDLYPDHQFEIQKYPKKFNDWFDSLYNEVNYPELTPSELHKCLIYWNIPTFGTLNSLVIAD